MSVTYKLNGSALTGRVQFLPRDGGAPALVTAAERGSLGTCGVLIEDADGSLTFNGWGIFTVEDSAASPVRVFKGIVADRNIGRLETFYAGASRVYDCDLYDLNELLKWLTPIDNDGKRPDETDVARVAWLLTNRALADIEVGGGPLPVEDLGLVSTSNAGAYLAADCRRRYPLDILREISESSVKNFFVYDDLATGGAGLFHDRDDASVWAAGISISNVRTEVNSTTVFAPSDDLLANRSASDVYQSVSYGTQLPPIFVESAAIETAFGFNRQAVYDTPRIGLMATAITQAEAWLNVRATEPDVITTRIRVPSSKINEVLAGQEISVKLTHVPRYASGLVGRIRRKSYLPAALSTWDVDLEIWFPPTPASDAEPSGGCVPVATHSTLYEMARGTPGSEGEYEIQWNSTGDSAPGGYPADPTTGLINTVPGNTGGYGGFEAQGTGTLTVSVTASMICVMSGPYLGEFQVLKNGTPVLQQAFSDPGTGLRVVTWGTSPLVGLIAVVPGDEIRTFFVDNAPGTDTFPAGTDHSIFTVDGDLCEEEPAETPLPFPGDPVGPETPTGVVDGVNTGFTTAGPYLPATLHVLHDGIDQTAHIAAQDPVAGTYNLDYAPDIGSTIREYYQSA